MSQKRTYILAFWLGIGLSVVSSHNGCSKAVFSQSFSSMLQELQSTAIVLINKDAPYTNSENVELLLESRHAEEVYVTRDSTCASGGTWQPISPTKNWTLDLKNQEAKVFAKFRNQREALETGCIGDAIIHDDIEPNVSLQNPVLFTNVNAPIFYFLAGDTLSGLDKTECEWPGSSYSVCNFSSSNGAVAEGRYLVKVKATDLAGNVSVPEVQDLLVDRTKPTVTLLTVPSALSNSTAVMFTFNAQDNLAGIRDTECSWNNGTTYAVCTSPLNVVRAEGAHQLLVRATDKAGNVGDSVSHSFAIDLTAPTVTITSSPADFSSSANAAFAFTGVDDATPITVFECRIDGQVFASCTSPRNYTGLAQGLHTFEVRGRDNSGNMSSPASRSWIVDTTAPSITFIQTPANPTKSANADYRYSIVDSGSGSGIASTQCSIDGAALSDCAADAKSYTGLAAGSHTFKVRATDKAGNFREATHSFVIDQNPPTIRFTRVPPNPSKDAQYRFEFVATDDLGVARVECRLDAGAWIACDSFTQHNVALLIGGDIRFSVRAIDTAANVSPEATHMWQVDLTPPKIEFYQSPPALAATGSTISLGFTATDAQTAVATVSCTLNGAATACTSGQLVTYPNMAIGDYVFVVTATDLAGNTRTGTKTWKIKDPVLKSQMVNITVPPNNKVDILIVVDNSGSMQTEQANMGARFSTFMDKIAGLDWQIGVITTDVSGDANLKDGRLVELEGMPGEYILRPGGDMAVTRTVFANTIQMPADGSGAEQGFQASIRALERAKLADNAINMRNAALLRPDAVLAIIVISDAYDTSRFTAENLRDTVKNNWIDKRFAFHSIVIPESIYTLPNGGSVNAADPCKGYRESVRYDGRNYHYASDLIGGIKGNACTEDYGSQLSQMGQGTAELINSVTLACTPVGQPVVTGPSGAAITNFTITGTRIVFAMSLPLGTTNISYYCIE